MADFGQKMTEIGHLVHLHGWEWQITSATGCLVHLPCLLWTVHCLVSATKCAYLSGLEELMPGRDCTVHLTYLSGFGQVMSGIVRLTLFLGFRQVMAGIDCTVHLSYHAGFEQVMPAHRVC